MPPFRRSAAATDSYVEDADAEEKGVNSRPTVPAPADIFDMETVRPGEPSELELRESGVIPAAPKVPELQLDPLDLDLNELGESEADEWSELTSGWEEVSAVRAASVEVAPTPTVSESSGIHRRPTAAELGDEPAKAQLDDVDAGWE